MKQDYVIQQGATWRKAVIWTNPDGTPVILRGATARLQIRPSPVSSTILLDLNSADGSLVITPDTGRISWAVSAEDTAALRPPLSFGAADARGSLLGSYDLLVGLGSDEYRIQQGSIFLSLGVTR